MAEELESEAKARGLRLLLDARDKTAGWCFTQHQARFNRRLLCEQDPRKPNIRDLAIAQRAFTVFRAGGSAAGGPRNGWSRFRRFSGVNGGDEFANTDLTSRLGDIQTATDWCMNLPVLMAGTETWKAAGTKGPGPGRDPVERPAGRGLFY